MHNLAKPVLTNAAEFVAPALNHQAIVFTKPANEPLRLRGLQHSPGKLTIESAFQDLGRADVHCYDYTCDGEKNGG